MAQLNPATTSTKRHRILLRIVLLALLASLLSGCVTTQSERLWMNAPGWSRAQLLGMASTMRPLSMDLDEEGTLYVVYFENENENLLTTVAIDNTGEEKWRTSFDTEDMYEGRYPAVMWTPEGVRVFWIVRGSLAEMILSEGGEIIRFPGMITEGVSVIHYDIARGPDGQRSIWFSSSRDNPGIFRLDPYGTVYEITFVDPYGLYPDVAYDANGVLHAAWAYASGQQEKTTYEYRQFPDGIHEREEAARSIQPGLRTSDDASGPGLGFDGLVVYLTWSASIRTGLRAGEIENMIAPFVPGFPETYTPPRRMFVTMEYDLPYEDWSGPMEVGPRMDWAYNQYGTDQLKDIFPVPSSNGESAIAMRTRANTRSGQSQTQIALAYLTNGELDSYQLLSFTYSASSAPAVIENEDGQLYAVWLELTDVDEFSIYLSSTVPAIRERYDELTSDDHRQMASNTAFGLVSGLLLAPVIFLWLLPAMIVLGLTAWLRRGEGRGKLIRSLICVLLAVGVYWMVKVGVFPTILTSVPFKVWVPTISVGLGNILRVAVPAFISVVGLLFAALGVKKRGVFSPAVFLLVYAIWDGLLTLAVYGVDLIRL